MRAKGRDEAPDTQEEEERRRCRKARRAVQPVEKHTVQWCRRAGRQRDEREYASEAQTVGTEIGDNVRWHEYRALLSTMVGGEKLAPVGIDMGPHLLLVRDS